MNISIITVVLLGERTVKGKCCSYERTCVKTHQRCIKPENEAKHIQRKVIRTTKITGRN